MRTHRELRKNARIGRLRAIVVIALGITLVALGLITLTSPSATAASGRGGGALMTPEVRGPLDPTALVSPNEQVYGALGSSVSTTKGTTAVGAPYETVGGVNDSGRVYLFSTAKATVTGTLSSPNPVDYGDFGYSVAVSGGTVVVGAPYETSGGMQWAGNAYVFSTGGRLLATLSSPDPQTDGVFGWSVAISGSKVVVGAPFQSTNGQAGAGAAYVFTTGGRLLQSLESPKARYYGQDSDGEFGLAVALGGSMVAVGAPGESSPGGNESGHACLFKATNGALEGTLTSPNAQPAGFFGASVAIGGSDVVIGAPYENSSNVRGAGHAYLFNDRSLSLLASLSSSNPTNFGQFGEAVAISGPTLLVGAPTENASGEAQAGRAYEFTTSGALSSTLVSPAPGDYGGFGWAVSVSGATICVGAPGQSPASVGSAGEAYLL
jgi:hypothetical protein